MAHAIWKGTINFGLVAMPVELVGADISQGLDLHMLDERDHAAIHFKRVNAVTHREVPWKSIVKAYKTDAGKYVIVTDKDMKKANVRATQTIDILSFVELKNVDVTYFDRPYYLKPTKGGEKPYALLRDTLKETEKVGISTVVIRTKQHLAAIMPKDDVLVLELLRFPDELKDKKEVGIPAIHAKVSAREIKMAKELVASMSSDWSPEEYHDTYREDLMKMINYKIKHGDTESIPQSQELEKTTSHSRVVDLMPLLRQSLEKSGHTPKPKNSKKKVKRGPSKVS